MKTRTNLVQWKHKASGLLALAWQQIRMGSTLSDKPGGFHRFCGFVHVKTLAIWIAVFEVFYLIYQSVLVSTDLFSPSSKVSSISSSLHAFAVILAFTAIFLHLFGIGKKTPTLLIPHMLMQILAILALFALSAFSLYALLVGTSIKINLILEGDLKTEGLQSTAHFPRLPLPRLPGSKISALLIGILILVAIFYATTAMITIWCFHVVLDCYRWLIVRITEKAQNSPQVNGNHHHPTIPVIIDPGKAHSPREINRNDPKATLRSQV